MAGPTTTELAGDETPRRKTWSKRHIAGNVSKVEASAETGDAITTQNHTRPRGAPTGSSSNKHGYGTRRNNWISEKGAPHLFGNVPHEPSKITRNPYQLPIPTLCREAKVSRKWPPGCVRT